MIAVTGGTGFVGRSLCSALEAAGQPAVPLSHQDADVTDRAALTKAFTGASAVVHLAGRAHRMRDSATDPLAEFRRVNVSGTENVVEAAADAGVRRVLLASSVKAVGERSDLPWTEDVTPAPVDAYGVSKLEAERAGLAAGARRGCEVVVMRFPLVYGPGAPANVRRLLALVDRGVPLPFGSVRNQRSMLSTANLAAAALALLGTPSIGGETFFLSDGRDVSTPDLIRLIAQALEKPARLFRLPLPLLRLTGRVGDLLGFPISTAELDRLTGSLSVSIAKLTRRTGYLPARTPEESWQDTAAWFRTGR